MSLPLLALVAGVIASAMGRMLLYVHYYGLSSDRLFAAVFMAWLAVVFIWFGLTTLRGRTRDFAAGMVITGFMTLGALNLVNHEALVARVNVARASAAVPLADTVGVNSADKPAPQSPIDYSYLTSRLDADAVSTVVEALAAPPAAPVGSPARAAEVRERCLAVKRLMDRWMSGSYDNDWRRWNLGRWRARRAIASREAALRQVTCLDSGTEVPFGDRDTRKARPNEQWYSPPATTNASVAPPRM
jgi:hypothetical protein